MAGFRNTEYRDEWLRLIPGTGREYADGTYFKEGDSYAVYDGAQNFVGSVGPNGSFSANGALTEYKASFLRTAKAEMTRLGLVSAVTEEERSMSVLIGHASIDENSRASGGRAGDQTGKEVCIRSWYAGGWDVVLRPVSTAVAEKMAAACETLCKGNLVGYDQGQRNTLWDELEKAGWEPAALTAKCETDCSAFMTACARCAGINVPRVALGGGKYNAPITQTMRGAFESTGAFRVLTEQKYLASDAYLKRGDILLRQSGHTAMVLGGGTAPAASTASEVKAAGVAFCRDNALAGTYECTAPALSIRNGAGTREKELTQIKQGDTVQCYGYYSVGDGAKWLYVTFAQGGARYTAFACQNHLRRLA